MFLKYPIMKLWLHKKECYVVTTSKYENEYWKHIFALQDYIEAHPAENFTSEQLAKIAGLSKYHFHRIFKALTNESIFQYTTRIKMEWALGLLMNRKDLTITDVAYELGFSDYSVFSRAFKKYFDVSPIEIRKQNSNNCKENFLTSRYNKPVDEKQYNIPGKVTITTLQNIPVIYKRIVGSYKELELTKPLSELFQYGMEHDLLDKDSSFPLTIYHSHPDITTADNQRASSCIIIKQNVKQLDREEIGLMEIPSGLYGVIHFEIRQKEYPDAWDFVYGKWLPSSGYLPANSFSFEVYLNNPLEDPLQKHIVDIYIPIEPIN
ncbi:AraC family transcriptional regulator [Listeria innocua]|nr:AraC family transcriptional regulator [Listeria innocua]EMD1107333.1 AraC family transcriptional regulator [Listeria innocua]EMD1298034.1 AraC family transcriptional regulator [Listeria innocua]EMD1298181.1 AraC family transcriptional regulator [Listeria innocua]